MKKLIFFSFFKPEDLKKVMDASKERHFYKDEFIVKEGQPVKYLYVITRGVATESCREAHSNFKEKKGVGSIISYHHIISGTQRYQTSNYS